MLGDLALVAPIPGYQKVEQLLLPMLEHFGSKGKLYKSLIIKGFGVSYAI